MEAPTFPFSSCQISFAKCSLVIDFSFCCFHYICWQLRKNGDCLFSLTEIPVQTSINRVCFQKCHISKIAFPDEKIFKFFVLWLDPFSLWKMPSLLPSLLSSGWMRKVPIILMFTWVFGAKEKPAISSVHMEAPFRWWLGKLKFSLCFLFIFWWAELRKSSGNYTES